MGSAQGVRVYSECSAAKRLRDDIKGRHQNSVENSYRPVARGYLVLGSGYLSLQVGSPGGRPDEMTISQLLEVPRNPITTQTG